MKIASKTPRCTWVRPLASILKCSATSFPMSIKHTSDSFKWRVIAESDFLATRCVPAAITDADSDVEPSICTARKGSAFTPPPLLLLNVRAETGAALLLTQTDRFGLPGHGFSAWTRPGEHISRLLWIVYFRETMAYDVSAVCGRHVLHIWRSKQGTGIFEFPKRNSSFLELHDGEWAR